MQISVIYHIKKLNDKNQMVISIDAEEDFDKIQQLFMIKNFPESRHTGDIPQHNTYNYKPTTNNILNGEKLKVFPLRSETRQGCPPSPLLFNIVLEILATAI